VNARDAFQRADVDNGDAFALAMLDGASVGVVGGNDFGSSDHFRVSYATSMEQLSKGLDAIENWLGGL
jgi:aspartate aminotransferase